MKKCNWSHVATHLDLMKPQHLIRHDKATNVKAKQTITLPQQLREEVGDREGTARAIGFPDLAKALTVASPLCITWQSVIMAIASASGNTSLLITPPQTSSYSSLCPARTDQNWSRLSVHVVYCSGSLAEQEQWIVIPDWLMWRMPLSLCSCNNFDPVQRGKNMPSFANTKGIVFPIWTIIQHSPWFL